MSELSPVRTRAELLGPRVGDALLDVYSAKLLDITATPSAVNRWGLKNAVSGTGPELYADGDDTNISPRLRAKGTGALTLIGPLTERNTADDTTLFSVDNSGNAVFLGTLDVDGAAHLHSTLLVDGDATLGARLLFTAAISKIVPGVTSLSLRNHADSADNLLLSDAGLAAFRNTLTVNAGGAVLVSTAAGVAATTVKNTGGGYNYGDFLTLTDGTHSLWLGYVTAGGIVALRNNVAADLRIVNAAGLANNLVLTDAGLAAFRNTLSVTAGGAVLTSTATGVAATTVQNTGGGYAYGDFLQITDGAHSLYLGYLTVGGIFALRNSVAADFRIVDSNGLNVNLALTDGGALTILGATTLSSTLHVVGAATLDSTLAVALAATLSSTLHLVGAGTCDSTLLVTGDATLGARLLFTAAASKIVPGATSLSLRNTADSAANLLLTDAGLATFRNTLTVSAGGAVLTSTATSTPAAQLKNTGGGYNYGDWLDLVDSTRHLYLGYLSAGGIAALRNTAAADFRFIDSTGLLVNLTLTDAGVATIRGGLTVSAGGLTITTGGLTVSAGGAAIVGANLTLGGSILDANGAFWLRQNPIASATTYLFISNGDSTHAPNLIAFGLTDVDLRLQTSGVGVLDLNYASVALGGGAAATLGTIAGSGPAAAAQNCWVKVKIAGVATYLPGWR